ncbi:MAG TPA: TetR/AcrR family transcriptional regulator [Bacteroidales bacterium]|nr:TetR/AcrR family transcriptional regulator [Bacteroidales bacterium]
MDKNRNVEKEIMDAARKVFQQKGYKEATMRDIASTANINMAMLHYYFRSKDNLFYLIFDESFRLFYGKIVSIIAEDNLELFAKIRTIVNEYMNFFGNNPTLPQFIVGEVIRNPEKISGRIKNIVNPSLTFKVFSLQLQKEYEKGNIRQISAPDLLLNIISLCLFPNIAQPVIKEIFEIQEVGAFMEERKKAIADFIINSLRT